MGAYKSHIRLFQVSAHHALKVEKDEKRLLLSIIGDKGAETRPAGIIPHFQPGFSFEARQVVVLELLLEMVGKPVIGWRRLQISTRQAGAIHRRVPLTVEYRLHGLAEESLTFFPDRECCPPSSAQAPAWDLALLALGQKGELVRRG